MNMLMGISELSAVANGASPVPSAQDAKAVAREFDAMLLEVLLRQSGLFQSMAGGGESAEPAFMSEMFLQNFARDLAARVDLGFGSLLLSQTQQAEGETNQ